MASALPPPIDQDRVNAGGYTPQELFYAGAELFSHRFTTEDGFGEAPDGPRRKNLHLADNRISPFLRINGLDAMSCQECHFQVGQRVIGGRVLNRELGTLGSAAGIASNVMIFRKPDNFREGIIRNPPSLFGVGYVQRLSDEMTADLVRQMTDARRLAMDSGETVRVELRSKGISFGHLTALPVGALDRSELDGVSIDFVVRPFQFKGVASSLRNFVAGALNFHFSVQPRELIDRDLILDDNPSGMLKNDVRAEIGEGEVSAIAFFLAALRPPVEDTTGLDASEVSRGREVFAAVGCAECHVPSLRIDNPELTLLDPRYRITFEPEFRKSYVSILKNADEPVWMVPAEHASELLDSRLLADAETKSIVPPGLRFSLVGNDLPDESHPRLPVYTDGSMDVPLFSDLKRHRMGAALADTTTQPADAQSISMMESEFVTRPLWGVADTGPWLHDGRATTLREAIGMHAGDGSEANDSVAAFTAAGEADQAALLEFLASLRLSTKGHLMEPGVTHRQGFMVE